MKTKSSSESRRAPFKPRRILVPRGFFRFIGARTASCCKTGRGIWRLPGHRLRSFSVENVGDELTAELEVRVGQPAEEIVAAARESKCDSIVLSTRGLTGLDRYLIGSVAHRIAPLAPCPVVPVRPGKRGPSRKQKGPAVLRFKQKSKVHP